VLLLGAGMSTYLLVGGSRGTKPHPGRPEPATTYVNTADGYQISYPASWSRATDAQGGLVLHIGGQNAVSIRKFTLQEAVDTNNINQLRAVTDAVLSTPDARLTILAAQQVTVAGLDGIYYLYTFPSGPEQGVHAHYFLFSGKDMYSTVFQALPAADFTRLAGTFDTIAKSFVVHR
jgi:hypothetical protein